MGSGEILLDLRKPSVSKSNKTTCEWYNRYCGVRVCTVSIVSS